MRHTITWMGFSLYDMTCVTMNLQLQSQNCHRLLQNIVFIEKLCFFGEELFENYPVTWDTGELPRRAKPTEVRLHIRSGLCFDEAFWNAFVFMFIEHVWLVGACVLSRFGLFFCFWMSVQGRHGEVLHVWHSSIENTSNCPKCIFQASGQSMLCQIRVHCFGWSRAGAKVKSDGISEMMF